MDNYNKEDWFSIFDLIYKYEEVNPDNILIFKSSKGLILPFKYKLRCINPYPTGKMFSLRSIVNDFRQNQLLGAYGPIRQILEKFNYEIKFLYDFDAYDCKIDKKMFAYAKNGETEAKDFKTIYDNYVLPPDPYNIELYQYYLKTLDPRNYNGVNLSPEEDARIQIEIEELKAKINSTPRPLDSYMTGGNRKHKKSKKSGKSKKSKKSNKSKTHKKRKY